MQRVWTGPPSGNSPVATTRSVVTYRRSAAPSKTSSKKGSGPRIWPDAGGVGPVHVHDGRVEAEGGHRHELLARLRRGSVTVRSDGVDREHVGAQPGPRGQERNPLGGGQQPQVEHALVELGGFDGPGLPGRPEVGVDGDRVEGDEAEDHLGHLAGRAEQADVRARRRRRR